MKAKNDLKKHSGRAKGSKAGAGIPSVKLGGKNMLGALPVGGTKAKAVKAKNAGASHAKTPKKK